MKFISDGCTGVPDEKFRHCCEQHDAYYHDGSVSRWDADKALFKCIINKAHDPIGLAYYFVIACVYWVGVRVLASGQYTTKEEHDAQND